MTVLACGDRSHWAAQGKPCRHCKQPMYLRDDDRLPSRKACVEQALILKDTHRGR
jgi:hypothetical protein